VSVTVDHARPLTPSGNLRRRLAINRLAESVATAAAGLAVAVLGIVVFSVVRNGGSAISFAFLTQPPPVGLVGSGGGIGPAIAGTALIVGVATVVAAPIAILVALYTTEFASRRGARVVGAALDLLNGLPTIVIGIFMFGLLVAGRGQSGFAASLALAIIMLPLIARSAAEVLQLVPKSLSDAADALGVARWRTVRGVLLPNAVGGILTATVLAVARAAGETAPLILLCSISGQTVAVNFFDKALPNIPVTIFSLSEDADPDGFTRAWGAALVLLVFILVSGLAGRILLGRTRAKLAR
jgi:phosphate transport system permease protein